MKKLINSFLCAGVIAAGYLAGSDVYHKLKDPYERAKIKRKIQNVKDAIIEKKES